MPECDYCSSICGEERIALKGYGNSEKHFCDRDCFETWCIVEEQFSVKNKEISKNLHKDNIERYESQGEIVKVDLKSLIRKYARYVYKTEGTDFLDEKIGLNGVHTDDWKDEDKFTPDEIEVLKEICVKVKS